MIANRYLHGVVLAAAVIVSSACATVPSPALTGGPAALPCSSGQSQVREQLQRLNAVAAQNRAQLRTYSIAMQQMLVACDAEARTMSVTLADDWRLQSFFVRRDLARIESAPSEEFVERLPLHRRRVERLIATYTAMYGNLPLDR